MPFSDEPLTITNLSGCPLDDELVNEAVDQIYGSNPNVDCFVIVEWNPQQSRFKIGYLTYFTEESVFSEVGQWQGLTEENIGMPCQYWVEQFEYENGELIGGAYEVFDKESHPLWHHQ
ncbi:hypothetical protein NIES4103_27600 [Nostoc sp. NIES-4103]|nr:hypothetical protein NIES4103_27600 [Nostoc sp. NIES-4103]